MTSPFKLSENALLLSCRVIPGASKNIIIGEECDAAGNRYLKIKVTAAPEKGKANKAVIKLLGKSLGLPRLSPATLPGIKF